MKSTAIAVALARGSWSLTYGMLQRAWGWCMAGEGANKVWRAMAIVVGVGAAYRLTGSSPAVLGGVALAALGVAWMRCPELIPVMPEPEEESALEGESGAEPSEEAGHLEEGAAKLREETAPVLPLEGFSALVRELAQDGAGAHLSALAEYLPRGPWDTAAVRALCTAHGVPVSKSVRQPGRGVSTGVKVEDLPPLPKAPLEGADVAVVVAGQDTTTGSATATTTPIVKRREYGNEMIRPDWHQAV
ncbi:hypothetical protein ABZ442_04940 [Streptomyces triculaminicus]|uniref:hypothetical protein n=1 Tax=Streptomyces triculaminicus TaxID=2816232 RepID=UPI0033C61091